MGLQSEHGILGLDTVYFLFEEAYIMLLLEYDWLYWLYSRNDCELLVIFPMQLHNLIRTNEYQTKI